MISSFFFCDRECMIVDNVVCHCPSHNMAMIMIIIIEQETTNFHQPSLSCSLTCKPSLILEILAVYSSLLQFVTQDFLALFADQTILICYCLLSFPLSVPDPRL